MAGGRDETKLFMFHFNDTIKLARYGISIKVSNLYVRIFNMSAYFRTLNLPTTLNKTNNSEVYLALSPCSFIKEITATLRRASTN